MKDERSKELEIFKFLENGNKEFAANLIYNIYYDDAVSFYQTLGGNHEDAEDLFPFVVLNFFEKYNLGKYMRSENASLKTYLFAIMKFQFYKKLRDTKEVYVSEFLTNAAENDTDFDDLYLEEEFEIKKKEILKNCMNQLNENCNKIIKMYYYDRFSMIKIAQLLGYGTEKVAKTTKNRCMNKLKDCCLAKKLR